MKQNKLAVAVGAAVLGLSSVAQAEISANIGATSNYVFRGVTQTDNGAAIQGGIDYSHESGFYAGTWASNVDFGGGGEEEVDFYAGFAGEMDAFGYDVGAIYYAYPSSDDADFVELYASASFGPVTAGLAYTVSSDVDDTAANETFIEGDLYYYLSAGTDLSDGWSVGGTIGYVDFEDDGVAATDTSYMHYQLDVTKSAGDFGDFTMSVSMADEESGDEDPIVFVSWAKSF
jgi:uncharacterized protein (TIGR02001 family)